mmetsp:Transcript_122536/g.192232  ORF Transcript_122536/g.192232 Transcript_122536/m.192232 type:complete len:556 (-) Transcript_122536:81-1748(-)
MSAEPKFSSLVVPPGVPDGVDGMDARRTSSTRRKNRQASRTSVSEDSSGVRGSEKKRATSVVGEVGICQKVVKKTGPTLVEQAMMFPGRMRVREMDPRRIVYKDSASTRVVIDPRARSYQGACRIVDVLHSTIRRMQFTMKLTGLARASIVPEDNGEPSDDEDLVEESDDNAVNSDDDMSSNAASSKMGYSRAGSSYAPSSMSRSLGTLSAKHHKRKAQLSGWLSQYSGCTKGHGERLLNKIYLRRCQELKVKVNSGMKEILLATPPCFCSLQSANLSNLLLGDRGVQGLWPLLRYARALRSLNLAGNGIRDSGTRHIIKVFESEFYKEKNNEAVGLLILDLSHNPITGACAEELYRFYESRKDIILLGTAKTAVPNVKRQRLVRACLAKLAGSDSSVMLEAWRLAKDGSQFYDLELFLQCERIVEATHGTVIHDMFDQEIDMSSKGNRRVSWGTDGENWDFDNDQNNDQDDLDADLAELEAWGDFAVTTTPPPPPSPPGEYVDIEFDRLTPGSPSPPPRSPSPQTKNPFAKNDTRSSWASRRQKNDFVQRCQSR